MSTPVFGSATAATSGTERPPWLVYSQVWPAPLACSVHGAAVSHGEMPPPLPIQAISSVTVPVLLASSVVPPTPVVYSPSDGQLTPGGPSGAPVDATSGHA